MSSRKAQFPTVYRNGVEDPTLKVISVHRATGGKQLDRAVLQVDLGLTGNRVENIEVRPGGGDDEIQIEADTGNGLDRIHIGKLTQTAVDLGGGESLLLTSRLEPYHFGGVLLGMIEFDALNNVEVTNPARLVFNPEIDGKIEGNLSAQGGANGEPRFVDPESLRTSAARDLNNFGTPALFWTLPNAVLYLCTTLNPLERVVRNPNVLDLDAVLDGSEDLLANFELDNGLYLPQALDKLLEPFGYSWYVDLEGLDAIRVFKRGEPGADAFGVGSPRVVHLQEPGNAVSSQDNAAQLRVDYALGPTANAVAVLGDWVFVEGTFELDKAWPEALDELDAFTALEKGSQEWDENPAYHRAWRDWVLNEAGDYTDTRPEITSAYNLAGDLQTEVILANPGIVDGVEDADELTRLLGVAASPRRRKFLPTLTQAEDGTPIGETHGVTVEWSQDDGATWQPLEELECGSVQVLDRECGIRFDSQNIPEQLQAAGDQARVRVTATVRTDLRLVGVAPKDDESPLADVAPELVDAASRYHYRVLLTSSKYKADVDAGDKTADVADDREACAELARQLKGSWDQAEVSGSIEVEGIENGYYQLGDVIQKVEGREISFSGKSAGAAEQRYPQIVGITYDFQRQRRLLTLETFREAPPPT